MCVVYLLPLQFKGGGFGLLDHEDPVTPPPSEEHSWCGHLRPGKWVARPKYFTATARKNERNSCHVCTFLCENKRSDSKSHFRQCQGSWSQSRRHKPVRGGGVVQGNMATWPIALICVTCATLRIYNDMGGDNVHSNFSWWTWTSDLSRSLVFSLLCLVDLVFIASRLLPQLEASFVMVFRTTSTLTATALLVLFAEQCSGMKILVDQSAANADAVAACYSGPEQDVWELVMGKQVREQHNPISIKDAKRVKSKPWLPGCFYFVN